MPFTPNQERWAEAHMILKQHGGERAQLYIAERLGALALAGDTAGVQRLKDIAHRLDQLIRPTTQ